jgi:hypothetical protein
MLTPTRDIIVNVSNGVVYSIQSPVYTLPQDSPPGLTLSEWWVDLLERKWNTHFQELADRLIIFSSVSDDLLSTVSPRYLASELDKRGISSTVVSNLKQFFYDEEGNVYDSWSSEKDSIHQIPGSVHIPYYDIGKSH